MKASLVSVAILILAGDLWSAQAQTNKNENLLSRILGDWEKRNAEIGVVTYKLSGSKTWYRRGTVAPSDSSEKLMSRSVGGDSNRPVVGMFEGKVALDFKRNRCRVEFTEDAYSATRDGLYRTRMIEVGANGITSTHIIENADPSLKEAEKVDFMILKGDRRLIPASRLEDNCYRPLFFANGVVPTPEHRVKTSDINPGMASGSFAIDGHEVYRGRNLVRLRVDYDRRYSQTNWYLVDVDRGSAIVRSSVQIGGADGHVTSCEIDYEMKKGLWLPDRWTTTRSYKRDLRYTETLSVIEAESGANLPDEMFVLNPSAGMKVLELDHKPGVVPSRLVVRESLYQVDAAGSVGKMITSTRSVDVGRSQASDDLKF